MDWLGFPEERIKNHCARAFLLRFGCFADAPLEEVEVCSEEETSFGPGTKLSVLDPKIPITPPRVRVLPPAAHEVRRSRRGRGRLTLVCVATGFYPDHVRVVWQVNGVDVEGGGGDSAPQWHQSSRTYSLSSRLTIAKQDWLRPQNHFTCITSFYNGSQDLINSHTIHGEEGCLSAEKRRMVLIAARFSYALFICKSVLYTLLLGSLLWKRKGQKSST
ncbi:hypothetical protein AAFF_G00214410 [Aldrovandia affinis]|uniref:Ig-like domain-containing protein n=1 Tax=Aldrovandia affinis TaxID=143900 RepID=A0AAD7RJE1_9TELE|nr:hypothetical protein AAFF_G00214410 [Aldrovandia affinis]